MLSKILDVTFWGSVMVLMFTEYGHARYEEHIKHLSKERLPQNNKQIENIKTDPSQRRPVLPIDSERGKIEQLRSKLLILNQNGPITIPAGSDSLILKPAQDGKDPSADPITCSFSYDPSEVERTLDPAENFQVVDVVYKNPSEMPVLPFPLDPLEKLVSKKEGQTDGAIDLGVRKVEGKLELKLRSTYGFEASLNCRKIIIDREQFYVGLERPPIRTTSYPPTLEELKGYVKIIEPISPGRRKQSVPPIGD